VACDGRSPCGQAADPDCPGRDEGEVRATVERGCEPEVTGNFRMVDFLSFAGVDSTSRGQ
jgi:hypothetical protein